MSEMKPGPMWPGMRKGPREFGRCATALKPNEVELEAAFFNSSDQSGALQSAPGEPEIAHSQENVTGLDAMDMDGLVAGIPVVGGVGEFALKGKHGIQVRMEVVVGQNRAQVEWLKSRLFGGVTDEGGEGA